MHQTLNILELLFQNGEGRECGYRYIIYTVTLKNGTPKKHLDVVLLNGS